MQLTAAIDHIQDVSAAPVVVGCASMRSCFFYMMFTMNRQRHFGLTARSLSRKDEHHADYDHHG